jgi:hypothetical protein
MLWSGAQKFIWSLKLLDIQVLQSPGATFMPVQRTALVYTFRGEGAIAFFPHGNLLEAIRHCNELMGAV